MSRLFITTCLDEDVDVLLAILLRSQGWTAVTVQEEGRNGMSDEEQLEFASQKQLTLITHNRGDFEKLAAKWASVGRIHAGIIIAVRRRSTYDLARRLITLLNVTTFDEMENQVFYI